MESQSLVKIIAYFTGVFPRKFVSEDEFTEFLSRKSFLNGQLAVTLADYLVKHAKKFDKVSHFMTSSPNVRLSNGTLTGALGYINRSEMDIGTVPTLMNEETTEDVDFAYPYELNYDTFLTKKRKYKPLTFGILQTFPLSVWIGILSILILLPVVNYVFFKRRYPLDKVSIHVLGVLLRQISVLMPSSVAENLLIYTWVVGAMIICLAYESTFLSFLSIPPDNQIKDISQLAIAVKKGEYHCVAYPQGTYLIQK